MAETFAPGASVSIVARRHDLNANMLFTWRRQVGRPALLPAGDAMTFVPAAITAEPARDGFAVIFGRRGRMEIVLAGGDRVIVGTDVDAAALARVREGSVAAMIPVPAGVRVWIATGHTDMRRGMNGLALQVQEALKRDPHAGDLYVFRGRRGDLIKILWHDGLGHVALRQAAGAGPVHLAVAGGRRRWRSRPAQLGYMLEGIDWRNPQHTWRPASAG